MAITALPAATLPESAFIFALGTQRFERFHHKLDSAVAILEQMRAGRPALIKKDGEELIAIVLDRPLAKTKALVEAPDAFITRIMQDKQNHPVIAQMIRPRER